MYCLNIMFSKPIMTQYVRINVKKWVYHISMRLGILTKSTGDKMFFESGDPGDDFQNVGCVPDGETPQNTQKLFSRSDNNNIIRCAVVNIKKNIIMHIFFFFPNGGIAFETPYFATISPAITKVVLR